jgi:hypothetical protein
VQIFLVAEEVASSSFGVDIDNDIGNDIDTSKEYVNKYPNG